MPLKGFKGFNRRKSFGNALDEPVLDPPPVSSFRVLERPHEPSKSFDGGHSLLRAAAEARPMSQGNGLDAPARPPPANRASHVTQNSSSSTGPYQSSSSARSTSTLPSAASLEQAQDESSSPSRATKPLPHTSTAPPGMFRTAFGLRKSTLPQPVPTGIHLPQHQHGDYNDIPDVRPPPRPRATTDTSMGSESTATASGFLVSDFGLKNNDSNDDFSNMFSNLSTDKKTSPKVLDSPATIGPSNGEFFKLRKDGPSRPEFARSANSLPITPAPPSVGSTGSHECAPEATSRPDSSAFHRKPSPSPSMGLSTDPYRNQRGTPDPYKNHRGTPSPFSPAASPSPRQSPGPRSLLPSTRTPSPFHDRRASDPLLSFANDDMALAMQYVEQAEPSPTTAYQAFPPVEEFQQQHYRGYYARSTVYSGNQSTAYSINQPSAYSANQPVANLETQPAISSTEVEIASPDAAATDGTDTNSILMTPKLAEAWVEPEGSINEDASMQEIAMYAERLEAEQPAPPPPRPKPVTTGKVMTPAQFERYKKEQERRQLVEGSDSESEKEESDKEDDDAEEERNKEMARHRRKQEADLAVYRQKMMKITGESTSQRPVSKEPSSSTSQIPIFSFGDKLTGSGGNSEEEDEDVPLGILAAHGFPSKTRAPSHMDTGGRVSVQYQSETYPSPPPVMSGALASGETLEKSKNLPAFAKNLPKDPFYGASLVTPADRQSLAFGSGASVHGGAPAAGTAPQGGLVGVIAKEERARALRRGNPSVGGFEASNAASGLGAAANAPTPGLPPAMSAEQHTQMQLTQQMQQMMQVQMQWMQQMMAMQQSMGHGAPAMPGMPGMAGMPAMPGVPSMPPASRPTSTFPAMPNRNHAASMYGAAPGQRQSSQRPGPLPHATQSTPNLTVPGTAGFASGGYAPSLAPSERSSIGQPSRYRPVSNSSALQLQAEAVEQQSRHARGIPGSHRGRGAENGHGHGHGHQANRSAGSSAGTSPKAHSPLRSGTSIGGTGSGPASKLPTKKTTTTRAAEDSNDDSDDASGWAAMHAARERRRTTWKGRADSRLGRTPEDAELEGLVGVMHYPIEAE